MDDWLKHWILRIVVVVVVAFLLTMGWIVFDGTRDFYRTADCAVVLGGTLGSDGNPPADMDESLNHLAGSLKANEIHTVVLACSESASGDPKSIVDALSRYLAAAGVPSDMMLEDANATNPESLAADVAPYMTKENRTSVLVVANYADITRLKLAFHRAGIAQVFAAHTGSFQVNDLPSIAGTACFLWQNVFENDVTPEAKKLVANVQDDAQGVVSKTTQTGYDSIKSPGQAAAMPNDPPAAPSGETVAPLADGQTANSTGIGSFQVPGDWVQQVVYPIMDPVWAPPVGAGKKPTTLMSITKESHPGSATNAASEIPSDITAAGFSNVQTLDQGSFTTAAGLEGSRLIVTVSKNATTMELAVYTFPGRGSSKIVIIGGCLVGDAATFLPIFDSCAKTLKV